MASSSKPTSTSISTFSFSFTLGHSSALNPGPVPGPSTVRVPIPKANCPMSPDPVWCSIYTIRQTRAWNSVLDIGSLGFFISHSQASLLPNCRAPFFTIPPESNKQIAHDLYEDAAKALTWVWEFCECQIAIKLLADRLSDCWFGGLSDLLALEKPHRVEALQWTLAVLETLDFLTRVLQTYESFHGRSYIFQALPALHAMFNFSDGPSDPSGSDSASELWIHMRCFVVQILYRLHPEEDSYRAHVIRALPPDDKPIYVTAPLKRLLTAIVYDYWRPIVNGTESLDASLCILRNGQKLAVPIDNFVGDFSVPATSSISYIKDYHKHRSEPQYEPMDLDIEDVLDSQAWDGTISLGSRSVAPLPADAPALRSPTNREVDEQALRQSLTPPVAAPQADAGSSTEASLALEDQLPPIESERRSLLGPLSDACNGDGPQVGLTSLGLAQLGLGEVDKPDDEAGSSASSEDSNEAAEVSLMLTAGRLSTVAGSDRCSSPLGSTGNSPRPSPSPVQGQPGPSRSLSPVAPLISEHDSAESFTDPSPVPSPPRDDIAGLGPLSDLDEFDWPSPPASPSPSPVKEAGVDHDKWFEDIRSQLGPRTTMSGPSWHASGLAKEKESRKSDCGGMSQAIRVQPVTSPRRSPTRSPTSTRLGSGSGPEPHAHLRTSPRHGPPGTEAIGRFGMASRTPPPTSPRRSPPRSSARRTELGPLSGPGSLAEAQTTPRRSPTSPTSPAQPLSTPSQSLATIHPVPAPGPVPLAQAPTTPSSSTPPGRLTAELHSEGPTPTIPSPRQASEAPGRPDPEPEAQPRATRSRAKAQAVAARRNVSQGTASPGVGASLGKRKRGHAVEAAPVKQGEAGEAQDGGKKKRARSSGRIAESEGAVREVVGPKATCGGSGKKLGAGEPQVRRSTRTTRSVVVKEEKREQGVVAESSTVGRKRPSSSRVRPAGQAEEELVKGEQAECSAVGRKRTRSGGLKRRAQAEEETVEGEPEGPVGRKRTRSSGPKRRGQEAKVKVEKEEVEPTTEPQGIRRTVRGRKESKPAGDASSGEQRPAPRAPGEASGLRPTRRPAKRGQSSKVKEEDPEPASLSVPAGSTHPVLTRPRRRVRGPEASAAVVEAPVLREPQRRGGRLIRTARKNGRS